MTPPDMTPVTDRLQEVQTRSFQVREVTDADERLVRGIGVPFGEIAEIGTWFREAFDPECVFEDIDAAKLMYRHGDLIGKLAEHTRTDAGLEVALRISETTRGDEAYTLARDGALAHLSIGFRPVEWRSDEDDVIWHTRVKVREFSLVPHPAYQGAAITEVRAEQPATPERTPAMTQTLTREEVDTLLEQRADEHQRNLDAALAQLRDTMQDRAEQPIGMQWRSAGDFLKAVAGGDQDALEFHRAFVGGTFAETATPSTWIADAIKLVDERRRQLNSFSRQSLPAEGMTLEYLKLNSNTIVVAEQAAEGDDLTFGEISLTSATSPVKIYGGYTSLGFRAIQRASTPYLNTALTAMDLAFAKATETAFKSALYAIVTGQATAGNKVTLASTPDVFDWLDLIVDAAETADNRGFALTGMKLSKEKFKQLYRLADSNGNPLLNVTGEGVNRAGVLRASAVTAELADIPVEMVAGAAPTFATFYDPVGMTTWEQPGAPVQLQDENVINLTKDFSKYGAVAFGSQFPTALIPIEFAA